MQYYVVAARNVCCARWCGTFQFVVSPTKVGVYGVVKEDNEQFMHDIVYVAAVVCPPPPRHLALRLHGAI